MGGKSGGSTTVGYDYYFGIHMGVGRGPVDELVEIRVADKSAWPRPESRPVDPDDGFGGDTISGPAYDKLVTIDRLANVSIATLVTGWLDDNGNISGGLPEIESDLLNVVFYFSAPKSWPVGGWVKIEGFKRTTIDPATGNRVFPGSEDRSGVYRIASNLGEEFRISVDPDDYLAWKMFAKYPPENEFMKFTRVANAAGDPLPVEPEDGSNTPPPTSTDPGAGAVTSSQVIQIDAADLFGGQKKEGGIKGPAYIMMGEPTQVAPAPLVAMHGEPLPGYRRMFTVFFDGLISSMNPYPKKWKFRVRRAVQGWDGEVFRPDLAKIVMTRATSVGEVTSSAQIHAMNPAHILFETLTNREWGRGLPRSKLDIASFAAAATTLYGENFGLCISWKRSDTIETFVQTILDHIGCTMYEDPRTALMRIKLIRGDYITNETPMFDANSGLLEVVDAPVLSSGGYASAIKVTYHDPISDEDRTSLVQNLASIQAAGGVSNTITKSYPGIPTPALANRVAQRDLQTLGLELRKFTLKLDRRGSSIRPGDVIRMRDPSRGIRETVIRVASYDDGTILDGTITIVGVQDVFGMPATSYVVTQPTGWQPPSSKPCIGRHEVFEMPYVMLARTTSAADFAYIDPMTAFIGTVVEQGQPLNASYQLAVRGEAPTPDDMPSGSGSYCGYVPPAG